MFKNDLWVSKYDNCLSGSGLPHSIWCFLAPSISLQISRCHYFFCCVIFCCVNVPHFPYPFFGQGTFRLFPGSGYNKQGYYEYNWAYVLVARLSILWIYTQMWYILLPLVIKEALIYDRAEYSKAGNPSRDRDGKNAKSGWCHVPPEGERC